MWGCLLSMLLAGPHAERITQLARWLVAPAIAVFIYFAGTVPLLSPMPELAAISVVIAFAVTNSHHWLAMLISMKPLAWIGTISYSIYIWQEAFMQYRNAWVLFIVMPAFALASYYLIERPSTRFGRRITSKPAWA